MVRKSTKLVLEEVPLNTRFRKFSGDRRDKVRGRAKIEVVKIGDGRFGVTVKRGIVSVKKGVVSGPGLTAGSVQTAVRRAIKAGDYDDALFDGYDKIMAEKKAKKKA